MKLRVLSVCEKVLPVAVGLLGLVLNSQAGLTTPDATPAKAGGAAPAASAGPVEVCIPKSIFALPGSPKEGKDPFFPRSTRPYSSPVVVVATSPTPAPAVVVEVKLQGFSGPPEHRLAIINNRTFEAGEEAEVPTNNGRTRIRCLSITGNSVLIQIGAEQRELRLRGGL